MHRTDSAKPCTPHDWTNSLEEPGLQVCGWACGAKREAPPAPVVGVDLPTAAVEAVVFARAA